MSSTMELDCCSSCYSMNQNISKQRRLVICLAVIFKYRSSISCFALLPINLPFCFAAPTPMSGSDDALPTTAATKSCTCTGSNQKIEDPTLLVDCCIIHSFINWVFNIQLIFGKWMIPRMLVGSLLVDCCRTGVGTTMYYPILLGDHPGHPFWESPPKKTSSWDDFLKPNISVLIYFRIPRIIGHGKHQE